MGRFISILVLLASLFASLSGFMFATYFLVTVAWIYAFIIAFLSILCIIMCLTSAGEKFNTEKYTSSVTLLLFMLLPMVCYHLYVIGFVFSAIILGFALVIIIPSVIGVNLLNKAFERA